MKALLALFAAALAAASQAQSWPTKALRAVVPYPPGGGVDFVARTVGQRLSERLKQPVIVENRSGASGAIGAESVSRSPADGYTFLVASPAEVLAGPIAGQRTAYDPQRDLSPVTLIGETPLVIAAHPSLPAQSMQELFALAKKEPGKHAYGTPGDGSTMHFAGESLNAIAGIRMEHIPYRGAAPVVSDLLGGQVRVAIVGMPPTVAHAKGGKLRILAVTSAMRSAAMPHVPAVSEIPGFHDYRFTNWMGVYVPAKTPTPIVERLAAELAKVVLEPEIRDKLIWAGIEPVGNTPAEFAAFLAAERRT
jgi:tripartite-type tricarboxylate transporter receptor subunit TctC